MNATDSAFSLDHLSNDDLLTSTRGQVGRSNQVLAGLLAHLAEVDARGLYRLCACSSLNSYCVYELRMSEDAAQRRTQATKIARRFPVLFEQIAAGELHLTGVLMLGPLLTETNHLEVLARAKHRTKRELAGLLRRLDPLPDVPARIEPLGPATNTGWRTHSGPSSLGPRRIHQASVVGKKGGYGTCQLPQFGNGREMDGIEAAQGVLFGKLSGTPCQSPIQAEYDQCCEVTIQRGYDPSQV